MRAAKLQTMGLLLAVCFAGCGPGGAGGKPFDLNGDGTSDGYQFDSDNDGDLDAVDLNGDGVYEGGDYDGDGTITLFTEEGTGYLPATADQLAGLSPDVDPDFDRQLDPMGGMGPEVVTKTAVDLTSSLVPILNQGQMGSCAAFANAVVGSLARSRVDGAGARVSTAFLYERQLAASQTQCKDGTFIHTGLETLMREGAPLESELPYSDQMCTTGSAVGPNGSRSRIGGYSKLEPYNRARVKEVLSSGVPVVFGCTLPPNFMTWAGAPAQQVFRSDNGQAGGPHGGGHAMVIVGYDDQRGAYRVQNSWGTDWGDNGYLWWAYDDLDTRDGLQAYVPQLLPNGSTVDPNPSSTSLTVEVTGALQVSTDVGTFLVMRLHASGAFHLTQVSVPALGAQDSLDTTAIYIDVVLPLSEPATAGTYEVQISGDVGGASISKSIGFAVGDPITDPG